MTIASSLDKSSPRRYRSAFSLFPVGHSHPWALPDVPSDIIIEVGGISFALHKFPLVSRCGLLRMLVAEEKESEASKLQLDSVPGGAEGFELAAKFCYGVNLEISNCNVALLRCVAEFLDMSEEHGEDNLVSRTESFLENLGKQTFKDVVIILRSCENLIPMAEDLKIVNRCIEWAASKAVREPEELSLAEYSCAGAAANHNGTITFHECQASMDMDNMDWWAEDLSLLRIDLYRRVLSAMRARGLRTERVGGALVYYAHRSLKGLTKKRAGLWDPSLRANLKVHDACTAMEHEQRILVETIVSLLPREKNVASISFLIGLLRTASILETTLACRLDLERRIGMQLHKATLDDLLISSYGHDGETLFDVDTVHRLVASFIEQQSEEDFDDSSEMYDENDGLNSPAPNPMFKIGKLVDGYLSEIAADGNLGLSKFIALAELLPEYARPLDDGLYRAVDTYLKSHPASTDVERKKLCKLLDFQKLSQDACTHAAQNERLPLQAVVQVLYFEQMRIRNVMAGSYHPDGGESAQKISSGALSAALSPKDHYASVRRENRELKLEVARMRMRLSDLEKDHVHMKQGMEKSHQPHHHHHHYGFGLFHAVSKSLSKLNPFHHYKLNPFHHHHNPPDSLQHQQHSTHGQPARRAGSLSSVSSLASDQPKKEPRRRRHSLS